MQDFAWRQNVKTTSDKMVLLALAHFHNTETGRCDPSFETLSKVTGLSRRSVIRSIKALQVQGLLQVKKRKVSNALNQTNCYAFRDRITGKQVQLNVVPIEEHAAKKDKKTEKRFSSGRYLQEL